ncbi:MAG: UDP-N-acetylmuramoyl-L-alanine--D-glutamate ligase, partial [Oscillospiraceae bacterium]
VLKTKAEMFFEEIKNKKVTFIGAGVSHKQLISMFAQKGIKVTLRDKKSEKQLGSICDEYARLGVEMILGEDYLENITEDIILRTPGMYFYNEKLAAAMEDGKVVTSEIELFLSLCPCKKYAVTGSDGKTTTTTIIARLLEKSGKKVFLGGNIGTPLLPKIFEVSEDDVAVVELSSFQLLSMREAVDIAVITNIAPNHLDVHGTMEEYINAKKNIVLHQNGFSRTVLNFDNEETMKLKHLVRGSLYTFSLKSPQKRGAYLGADGILYAHDDNGSHKIMHRDEIKIPGIHNVDNFLTAICAVWGEVCAEDIREFAKTFGGVPHRIEFVREKDGVRWYNDSIATSPTRTIAGLNSFDQKIIVIAGGYDKKIPFEPLAPTITEKVKLLILCGDTSSKIEKAITSYSGYEEGEPEIIITDCLENAVKIAKEKAVSGDIVSLSPACASFDRYPNFEARGEHFRKLVENI